MARRQLPAASRDHLRRRAAGRHTGRRTRRGCRDGCRSTVPIGLSFTASADAIVRGEPIDRHAVHHRGVIRARPDTAPIPLHRQPGPRPGRAVGLPCRPGRTRRTGRRCGLRRTPLPVTATSTSRTGRTVEVALCPQVLVVLGEGYNPAWTAPDASFLARRPSSTGTRTVGGSPRPMNRPPSRSTGPPSGLERRAWRRPGNPGLFRPRHRRSSPRRRRARAGSGAAPFPPVAMGHRSGRCGDGDRHHARRRGADRLIWGGGAGVVAVAFALRRQRLLALSAPDRRRGPVLRRLVVPEPTTSRRRFRTTSSGSTRTLLGVVLLTCSARAGKIETCHDRARVGGGRHQAATRYHPALDGLRATPSRSSCCSMPVRRRNCRAYRRVHRVGVLTISGYLVTTLFSARARRRLTGRIDWSIWPGA